MTINERFSEILKVKGISVKEAALIINKSEGYVRKLMVPNQSFGLEPVRAILNSIPDINSDWLITGEGEMLIDKINFELPKVSYTTGIPYYNVDFIGGFDVVLNDQTVNPEYLIDFKKYNDANCWCNVTGHSMYPEITHGDMIALREIKDFSFLPLGEVYAIVTTNGMRTIKRLGGGADDDHYILVPTNKAPEYGIQPIPKKMISKVFLVLGCMKRL